jgi:uncharacterized protein YneF (UPF0154 family)
MPVLVLAQGLQMLGGILSGSFAQYQQIMAILKANGYAGDTNALDEMMADAAKRSAKRAEEAQAEQ